MSDDDKPLYETEASSSLIERYAKTIVGVCERYRPEDRNASVQSMLRTFLYENSLSKFEKAEKK